MTSATSSRPNPDSPPTFGSNAWILSPSQVHIRHVHQHHCAGNARRAPRQQHRGKPTQGGAHQRRLLGLRSFSWTIAGEADQFAFGSTSRILMPAQIGRDRLPATFGDSGCSDPMSVASQSPPCKSTTARARGILPSGRRRYGPRPARGPERFSALISGPSGIQNHRLHALPRSCPCERPAVTPDSASIRHPLRGPSLRQAPFSQ